MLKRSFCGAVPVLAAIMAGFAGHGSVPPPTGSMRGVWPGGADCAVSLTFDDANPYHEELIAPLLLERGLAATFFLNLGGLACANPQDRIPRADWNHYRRLVAAGMEVGSHTVWHKDLTTLGPDELDYEVRVSRERIEHFTGREVRSFAYPYNAFDRRSESVVRDEYDFARIGNLHRTDYLLDRYVDNQGWDLHRIRAVVVTDLTPAARLKDYVEVAASRGTWLVFQFHGVEGLGPAAKPVAYYEELIDYLASVSDRVWVAPLGVVGEYVRETRSQAVGADALPVMEFGSGSSAQ